MSKDAKKDRHEEMLAENSKRKNQIEDLREALWNLVHFIYRTNKLELINADQVKDAKYILNGKQSNRQKEKIHIVQIKVAENGRAGAECIDRECVDCPNMRMSGRDWKYNQCRAIKQGSIFFDCWKSKEEMEQKHGKRLTGVG